MRAAWRARLRFSSPTKHAARRCCASRSPFLHLHRRLARAIPDDPEARARAPSCRHAPSAVRRARPAGGTKSGRVWSEGAIDGFGARALSNGSARSPLQQAGCERIATTPLPYVYSLLIYRTTYLFCLLLPLSLVATAGWFTPIIVGIVAYVFLGLAEVSEGARPPVRHHAQRAAARRDLPRGRNQPRAAPRRARAAATPRQRTST